MILLFSVSLLKDERPGVMGKVSEVGDSTMGCMDCGREPRRAVEVDESCITDASSFPELPNDRSDLKDLEDDLCLSGLSFPAMIVPKLETVRV